MDNEILYGNLRQRVEQVVGRQMKTPRDFDYLSMRIFEKTKAYLSPITLKRFWGYLGEKHRKRPYRTTLNILAQSIGYVSIEAFMANAASGVVESEFLVNDSLQVAGLKKGARLELLWYPNRCVIVEYMGLDMFKVVESMNSKLSVGDTFLMNNIIDSQPLTLRCLVHDGQPPVNYVCGKINGVKYREL